MGAAGDAAAATAGRKRGTGTGTGTGTRCELCGGLAAVHCAADSAFLCLRCDAKVHGANFLASRHLRRRLPATAASSASSASSTSCVSTADSAESTAAAPAPSPSTGRAPARRQRPRAEAVLEGWAKRMGFEAGTAHRRAAAAGASLRALGRGVAAARVPLRVAMAAALWAEVAAPAGVVGCRGNGGEAAMLRRLEAAAHVPARLVLTVASWMSRAASRPAVGPAADADADAQDHEEGWAECS